MLSQQNLFLEELMEASLSAVEKAQVEVSKWKKFLAESTWLELVDSYQETVRSKRNTIFQMQVKSLDEAFMLSYLTAEVAGVQDAIARPLARLEEATADLNIALEEERNNAS